MMTISYYCVVGEGLRDALAHLPDLLDLGGLRGHGAIHDEAALHGVLEERVQLLLRALV